LRPKPGEEWHGYGAVETTDGLADSFRDLVHAVLDSPELAGLCWTQLTDTEQETNGLLTAAREPKIPLGVVCNVVGRRARSAAAEVIDAARREAREADWTGARCARTAAHPLQRLRGASDSESGSVCAASRSEL